MLNQNKDTVNIPANQVPSFRTAVALQNKVAGNLLFTTWGGIGDQICAEPTLRFALDTFKDIDVSLATDYPELFAHLKFKKVYDLKIDKPDFDQYLKFDTINDPKSLTWEFMSHCVTHCVDFPSLCALRCTLPIDYKVVKLRPQIPDVLRGVFSVLPPGFTFENAVFIHAGAHWESKTFPARWWEEVVADLVYHGYQPVLIGKEMAVGQGTVQINSKQCVDLRNKTTLNDTIWLLQRARFVLTNDSSPMHMAATGDAHIAFVATAKHPDYLYHWRKNEQGNPEWAWRMKDFGLGGMWDLMDHCPNKESDVLIDKVDPEILKSWLPDPRVFSLHFNKIKRTEDPNHPAEKQATCGPFPEEGGH